MVRKLLGLAAMAALALADDPLPAAWSGVWNGNVLQNVGLSDPANPGR
jgi:hypothetical protein